MSASSRSPAAGQNGVSLIEALVAMAIMAFGMLSVVGLQATLRGNSDLARQRSEALRFAQQTIEQRRTFSTMVSVAGSGRSSFDTITSQSAKPMTAETGANATYQLSETVATASTSPALKSLAVTLGWTDRAGASQSLILATMIGGVSPELMGALSASPLGSVTQQANGRNMSIPQQAVDQGDGTSRLTPSPDSDKSWIINNTTGLIVQVCSNGSNGSSCSGYNALLLDGYIQFAVKLRTAPTAADAQQPPGFPFTVEVAAKGDTRRVNRTNTKWPDGDCVTGDAGPTYIPYFCALPIDTSLNTWNGAISFKSSLLTTDPLDSSPRTARVCRYTTVRSQGPVSSSLSNADHPLKYAGLASSLPNQNYLVIRSGDGSTAFGCPKDDRGGPVDFTTMPQQPSS